jgi:hypothetical protein
MRHRRRSPALDLADVYYANGGTDEIPRQQARERERLQRAKLAPTEIDERERRTRLTLARPEPQTVTCTEPSPVDGKQMQVSYDVLDVDYARRWTSARQRAEVEHAASLVMAAARPRGAGRPKFRRGHRRATATRAGPDDDSGPSSDDAPHDHAPTLAGGVAA